MQIKKKKKKEEEEEEKKKNIVKVSWFGHKIVAWNLCHICQRWE
jgi:hypothetical protein